MAFPMVHLCAAHALHPAGSGLFYLGSIAPDVVAERPYVTREEKDAAHCRGPHRLALLESRRADARKDAFVEGWLLHHYTDMLWEEAYMPAFDLEAGGDSYAAYRRDAAPADVVLFDSMAWANDVFASMADAQGSPGIEDVGLSMAELLPYAKHSLAWYTARSGRGTMPPRGMFSAVSLLGFCSETAHSFAAWCGVFELTPKNDRSQEP